MLSRSSAPQPIGKKVKTQQVCWPRSGKRVDRVLIAGIFQNAMIHVPKTIAVQPHALALQTSAAPSYTLSSSYALDSQRASRSYAGQAAPASATVAQLSTSALTGTVMLEYQTSSTYHNNERRNGAASRSYQIYPSSYVPDAFIYARSDDARSDTLTSYSSSSAETFSSHQSSTTATSSTMTHPGREARQLTGVANGDIYRGASSANLPETVRQAITSISSANPSVKDIYPRASEGRNPGPSANARRGSGSDTDDTVSRSSRRTSPPRTVEGIQFPSQPSRDGYSSESNSSGSSYVRDSGIPTNTTRDVPRSRTMSGAPTPMSPQDRHSSDSGNDVGSRSAISGQPIATATRRSPTNERPYQPIFDESRQTTSPVRERFGFDITREGRSAEPVNQERVSPTRSNSYLDRHSSPESRSSEASSRGYEATAVPVRQRTLSNKSDAVADLRLSSKQVTISKPDAITQCRSVRFSERLICPSPVPPDKRRKGWFNKKG